MQGQYERKEERPYDYCRILLRINQCKNNTKKHEQRYDYDIILLIRMTQCKKKGKRKEGTTGQ